jgi:hypothetical protein
MQRANVASERAWCFGVTIACRRRLLFAKVNGCNWIGPSAPVASTPLARRRELDGSRPVIAPNRNSDVPRPIIPLHPRASVRGRRANFPRPDPGTAPFRRVLAMGRPATVPMIAPRPCHTTCAGTRAVCRIGAANLGPLSAARPGCGVKPQKTTRFRKFGDSISQ